MLRIALHVAAHRVLGAPRRPPLALVPLRDLLGVAVWALGSFGDDVHWRGRDLHITPDGEIETFES